MVEILTWDTAFFGRKIGMLTGELRSRVAVADELDRARREDFAYLICRPPVDDGLAIHTLEQAGFYLTDVGVTWVSDAGRYLAGATSPRLVRHATEADLPLLTGEAVKLFRRSRFYSDPFFSEAEADRLHVAWLENSVAGKAANAVLIIPDAGFVTCKLTKDGAGEVPLIGVWEQSRRRGAGRELMTSAIEWFATQGVKTVRVKTQVKNLRAMNFYHRLGFDIDSMDMTMGCRLSGGDAK
ncbi:MAG TPA: GNAT family N-acetyltransferase [Vicinamibacterales bacterium]|nr:GNAT family N-acetyltransferase [Vicinamibacterales bacterium]